MIVISCSLVLFHQMTPLPGFSQVPTGYLQPIVLLVRMNLCVRSPVLNATCVCRHVIAVHEVRQKGNMRRKG